MSIKTFNNDDIDRIVNNPDCVYYIHRFDVGRAFYDPVEQRFITQREYNLDGYKITSNGKSKDYSYMPLDMFTIEDFRDGIVEIGGKTITLDEYISISRKSTQEMLDSYFDKGLLALEDKIERTATELDASSDLLPSEEEDRIIQQVFGYSDDYFYYIELKPDKQEQKYPEEFKKIKAMIEAKKAIKKENKDEITLQKNALKNLLGIKDFGFKTSTIEDEGKAILSGLSQRTQLRSMLILEIPKRCFGNIEDVIPLFVASLDRSERGTNYQQLQVLQYAIPKQYIKCAISENAGEVVISDNPNYTPDYIMEEGIYDPATIEGIFRGFEECPNTIDVQKTSRLLDIIYSEYCYRRANDLPHNIDELRTKIDRISQISQFINYSELDDEQRKIFVELSKKFKVYYNPQDEIENDDIERDTESSNCLILPNQIGKATVDTPTIKKSEAQNQVTRDEQELEQGITKEN